MKNSSFDKIPFLEVPISSIAENTEYKRPGCVKFNFRADRTSRRGFTLEALNGRRGSYRGVLRLCELRGESLYVAARQRRHASTTGHGGDKRFIVLSFYAPDSLECELHYFAIVAPIRCTNRPDPFGVPR